MSYMTKDNQDIGIEHINTRQQLLDAINQQRIDLPKMIAENMLWNMSGENISLLYANLAEYEQRPVGQIVIDWQHEKDFRDPLNINDYLPEGSGAARIAHLAAFYVGERYRGQRIGVAVLRTAHDLIADRGYHYSTLDVVTSNGLAIGIYERCGYIAAGAARNLIYFEHQQDFTHRMTSADHQMMFRPTGVS